MDGFIILDKTSGLFSKSASMRVAKVFGIKKNGHIGTLDPMASGVLPVAIGNATKMIPFVEEFCDRTKEYFFDVQFGFETDTLDITGREIARTDIVPKEEKVRSVLCEFIGCIIQIPPAYSAVHISGVRAYELAREGKNPEIPPRSVDVYGLELIETDGKIWKFRMSCAPGTYVRSMARDIAKACGTVATVTMIRRTKTSGFTIKNAVTLDFLENLFNNGGDVSKYLMPMDSGLGDIPVLNLDAAACHLYKNGGFIGGVFNNGMHRIYCGKDFIGIGTVESGLLRPKRTI